MTYWAAFAANKWYKNKNNKMFDVRWNIKLKWFFLITACLHLSLCNLTTTTWRQKLPHHWVNSESYILIWIAEPGAWAWVQPTTVYSTTATLQTVLERPGPGRHRAVAPSGDRWSPVTVIGRGWGSSHAYMRQTCGDWLLGHWSLSRQSYLSKSCRYYLSC